MRRKFVIVALVVGLVLGCLAWTNIRTAIQIAFAEDQIRTFLDMLERVKEGELSAGEGAEYVRSYYPEGTKLHAGSSLSKSVELVRLHTLKELSELELDEGAEVVVEEPTGVPE